ncbi:MAG: hypothetical protein ACI853_000700, partial [Paracoccaceae bacterium]
HKQRFTAGAVFTKTGQLVLENVTPQRYASAPKDLTFYMTIVARLGGYLDRKSDPPPGTTVMWRGFSRLSDLEQGFRAQRST